MRNQTFHRTMSSFALGLAAAFVLTLASVTSTRATTEAETFVQHNIDQGLSILNDSSLNDSQRRDKFRQFILALTDMRRIAIWTLGKYNRGASDADRDAFVTAFTDYADAVYQEHLKKFKGQTLKISRSVERSPTDVIIYAQLSGPDINKPIEIMFRVLSDRGSPKVLDLGVEGAWLAQTEQAQFVDFLSQHNGDIHGLIDLLHKQTTSINAGETETEPESKQP
jgi:phospholipid transport system substrate-binding protein